MWATLRSDLREFVSTVAEESTTALNAIDSKLQSNQGTATSRDGGVVLDEDGNVLYDDNDVDVNLVDLILGTTTPKSDSDIGFNEEDLNDLLATDEEAKMAFETLVPEKITKEDFYKRYIVLQMQEEDRPNVLNGLKNFMEGAARVVAPLQGGGRPPFVMNTAVDEDDLGWDDEEEEEEDDEDEDEDNENDEEEGDLQTRLAQVEEERDLLHQTIKLQRQELEGVMAEKTALMTSVEDKTKELDTMKTSLGGDQKDFVETIATQEVSLNKLERESAAKDAELKSLKEQNQDYEAFIKKLNKELELLKKEVKDKDLKMEESNNKMKSMAEEMESMKKRLEEVNNNNSDKRTTVEKKNSDEDADSKASPPNSCSSAIKIDHEDVKPATNDDDEEEEDDWGEAWGEDSDDL